MASPNKTAGISILGTQEVTNSATANASVVSAEQNVATKFSATLFLYHAFREATANTNPQRFIIEVSSQESGDEFWAPLQTITTKSVTPSTTNITATEPIGETSLAVTASTNFAEGDIIFIDDTVVAADSEWRIVRNIPDGTTVDITEGLTRAKDASDDLWTDAEIFVVQLDLLAVKRIRVTYMNQGSAAADTTIRVDMITADTIA